MKARIITTGSYLPSKVLSNKDLEKMVDTTDEWIVSRTGMKERRIAAKDEATSDMGAKASQMALKKSSLSPDDIDFIIVSTLTPDHVFPNTAGLVQAIIGAKNAAVVDIQATCSGYLYALQLAKSLIESGTYKNILVVASEKLSSIVDYEDRSTCILFGDGACASIISNSGKGLELEGAILGADGTQFEVMNLPAGGSRSPATEETVKNREHFIRMNGQGVFKLAVRKMESASKECLEKCGLKEEDIQWFIAHQANERIIDAVAKRFSHLSDKQIYKTIHKYGNTSGSTVGIALDELLETEVIKEGERILLTAYGAGSNWGSAILKVIN